MSLKNSSESFGTVAKWLHWSTALLFLLAYISVYFRRWFTEDSTDVNWIALQLHLSFGVTVGVIVFLRVYWRIVNPVPDPEPGTPLEHLLIHIGHYTLYGVMILLPVTGYLGTGVNTEFFGLFEIPRFADTWLFAVVVENGLGLSFEVFEKPMDFVHKQILGAWLAWILILGHAAAALYHHFGKKDRTLIRMTRGS